MCHDVNKICVHGSNKHPVNRDGYIKATCLISSELVFNAQSTATAISRRQGSDDVKNDPGSMLSQPGWLCQDDKSLMLSKNDRFHVQSTVTAISG